MATARRRDQWSHTSHVLALVANIHRDVKKKPRAYSPKDFDPFVQTAPTPAPKASIRLLKEVFVDRR